MQIGPHYRNCWDALIGITRNDDLSPLYAGWKVVLCRDIPHSVIKFYTYEILKQVYAMEYDDEPSPATVPCDASIATELAKLSFHISSPKFG